MYQLGDYEFESHLEEIKGKGHWGEKLYVSYFTVRYLGKVIYKSEEQQSPIRFKIGDFNGNGNVDVFIFMWKLDREYVIIEFDQQNHSVKGYYRKSVC